jgi:uncharacterized metal-binding protein
MNKNGQAGRLLVIPCSGVGKVLGLMSREAAFRVTDTLLSGKADTVCLALLVTGDPETRHKVQSRPCVTVDGCHKLCALKNVEMAGGKVALGVRAYDSLKRLKGGQFGTATTLSEDGWKVVDEIAAEIVDKTRSLVGEEVCHG